MSSIRTLQRSFGGGEVAPEMFGRSDDIRYTTGLAKCLNFEVRPQGPAENRPGFYFVREVANSTKKTRVIDFTYSTDQTMVIELSEGRFRFHTQGATLLAGAPAAYNPATAYEVGDLVSSAGVSYHCIALTTGNAPPNATYWYAQPATGEYEVPHPYTEADLFDIRYVQSADVLTLVHPGYAPRELRRLGATKWVLSVINFTPQVLAPASATVLTQGVTTPRYSYQYVITALGADGIVESEASAAATGPTVSITGVTQANPGVVTTGAAHNLVIGDPLDIAGVLGMVQLNAAGYTVNTVPSPTTLTLKSANGSVADTTAFGAYTSGGTITPRCVRGNLFESGASNVISWPASASASEYNIYKMQGGVFGYIGRTNKLTFTDDNIAADLSITPPRYDTVFNAAGKYPQAVSYFEQRRCFAGTTEATQNFWGTRSATESAMAYSLPIRDDDRIAFRIAARQVNTIRHIVPLTQLLLLTNSAVWCVTSNNSDALTPSSINVKPQSYVGAAKTQPVVVNNTVLYAAARGGHIREVGYNWQAQGFTSGDLCLRTPHLFDTFDIVDMAYCEAPTPIVWFVSTSGKLLGLTYVPEQQVGAWHQHDTLGVFESCTVVAEGGEDVLYVVVRRTINGQTKRFIERKASRNFATLADAFFVDCGLSYSGAPTTTLSGLGHLEGETVSVLIDGAVHPQRVVAGGQITLEQAASKAHVGLPITADLQTLPLVAQVDAAFGTGRPKNINAGWLRVNRSSGIWLGPNADGLREVKQRTVEPYGTPPSLKSEELEIVATPEWNDNAQAYIRQVDPLPVTVSALTLEVSSGG